MTAKEFNKQERAFRSAAIKEAIGRGFLANHQQARNYEITFDGQFHLLDASSVYFCTGIKFGDFEAK